MSVEWKFEKCYSEEEAIDFRLKHGGEIVYHPGYPSFTLKGEAYYPDPESRPSWTVWYTE